MTYFPKDELLFYPSEKRMDEILNGYNYNKIFDLLMLDELRPYPGRATVSEKIALMSRMTKNVIYENMKRRGRCTIIFISGSTQSQGDEVEERSE